MGGSGAASGGQRKVRSTPNKKATRRQRPHRHTLLGLVCLARLTRRALVAAHAGFEAPRVALLARRCLHGALVWTRGGRTSPVRWLHPLRARRANFARAFACVWRATNQRANNSGSAAVTRHAAAADSIHQQWLASAQPPHAPASSWNLPVEHFAHLVDEPSPALPTGHVEHCWSATRVQPSSPNGSFPTPHIAQSLQLSWPVHSSLTDHSERPPTHCVVTDCVVNTASLQLAWQRSSAAHKGGGGTNNEQYGPAASW